MHNYTSLQEQFITCSRQLQFYKDCLLECVLSSIYHYAPLYDESMTLLLKYNQWFTTSSHKTHKFYVAINLLQLIISYYAGIMLNAFNDPLCSKSC